MIVQIRKASSSAFLFDCQAIFRGELKRSGAGIKQKFGELVSRLREMKLYHPRRLISIKPPRTIVIRFPSIRKTRHHGLSPEHWYGADVEVRSVGIGEGVRCGRKGMHLVNSVPSNVGLTGVSVI